MSYTHLHVHSGYSLMNSTIQISTLVKKAKDLGFTSLALTDDNVMSGAVAFYQACLNEGIKPIIGMRVSITYKNEVFPVGLLAKNKQGYEALLQLSTRLQLQEEPLQLRDVKEFTDQLVAIITVSDTSWATSIIHHTFERVEEEVSDWRDSFNDFYLGVKDYGVHLERQMHQPLKEWAEHKQVKVTTMNDVRYLEQEDAEAYYCLRAIDTGHSYITDSEPSEEHQYLKSPKEMEVYFKNWWPEVLETNQRIAESCNVEIDLDQLLLPAFPALEKMNADEYLRKVCTDRLALKYKERMNEAEERLNKELDVIIRMKFSDYFLIVWDFIENARKEGIQAGPGRGSAAGSIVSFLLGITQVDPLSYDLLFERFLNPERITMPDIDIDFPDDRRDEVIDYVARKYGKEHVAQICTFGTFATRSVLRELFKVLNVEESDMTYILKNIPSGSSKPIKTVVQSSEALKDYINSSAKLKKVFKIAAKLEGLPRHVSTHAAGVVISSKPLNQYTALMKGQENVHLTQMAMGDLESIGLLKMDFLGLRNLSFIRKIEDKVSSKDKTFQMDQIPINDKQTFLLLQKGQTNGVFQLESQGMKGVLKRLAPNHFEDVVVVNALYRPGPMEYIPLYIQRKRGLEEVNYPHPDVKPILERTFGVLVYQEQIMQVAQKIAGYSLGEADLLRRAVSKKQKDVLEQQQNQFVQRSIQYGYDENVATQLFEWIVKFSNYGFNRSHAVAYSVISYQLAYLKAHYPDIFIAELMNSTVGDQGKLSIYIREAREFNVKIKPPSINYSFTHSFGDQGAIRIGFLSIEGVGFQAAQAIIQERKRGNYKHLNDFCLRVSSKGVSRSTIESLIMAGSFDDLQQNRASLLASIDQALEQGELFKEFQDQPGLFNSDVEMEGLAVATEPLPILKQLSMEKEVLGTYLSNHPLDAHRDQLTQQGYMTLKECLDRESVKSAKTAAVVETIKEIRTKRGDPMSFLTLSDETREMDAVLFPDSHRDAKSWLQENELVTVNGKVENRNGKKQWIVNEISPFKGEQFTQRLFIKTSTEKENEVIERLKKIAAYFPGNTPIIIFESENRKTYQLASSYSLSATENCMNKLYEFFDKSDVVLRTTYKDV
ncbi:DNA polymerase III subunit alpha [Halobacillus seohaensis]|uniref:DNA polymerase III subunit alpha n=1 Tax=Halobacillus seohaensis TaxID=447421 RepID=A0ABW2EHB0_9BACI